MDFNTISMVISVVGSAVYSTWTLGKRCSAIETRLESHIASYEKVSEIEKDAIKERIDRLDRNIHELRNQLQTLTLLMAKHKEGE